MYNFFKNINLNKKYSGPFWLYNFNIIKKKILKLKKFDIIRFAQKSCSNINILKLIKKYNVQIDSVSYGELNRAINSGFNRKNIIFTSDIIDYDTLKKIVKLKITVNIGSIDMLHQLGKISPKHKIWIRINPGFGHGHNEKTNTGGENSKHGIWYNDKSLYGIIKKYNFKLCGIHIHIGSGVDYKHLKNVCYAMMNQILYINKSIKSISAGGGLSIPYKKKDRIINIKNYFNLWNNIRNKISNYLGKKITLEIEPGRFLTAESGILVTQVKSVKFIKNKYFVLIDAGFNDLLRPVMYGSYHKISVIKKKISYINKSTFRVPTIVGGPLCESGDIFTQNSNGKIKIRFLPKVSPGDYLIFHNTGAYGSSMSSNYNSRLLIPEILFYKNKFKIIRKKQNIKDLLKLEN
ncbi:Diaminopimelate decarboxylase [Candidatus Annandia adelgestsuga]|uniref:Diaminopimelate decarboxylase n=1 Tax=Candidatus Annandia adelgestsuga TaxID=1302411 RepID=A0A3Q9CLW9_9ENTR|nr:diaminopimelate decarboxylase [Candidatus Annandia adelgestsuga]AZP36275.1 Diaminopimelate decarboxylase [Candidatus Annandia adelgestsuga]